jgi:LTXXQ motif family protein
MMRGMMGPPGMAEGMMGPPGVGAENEKGAPVSPIDRLEAMADHMSETGAALKKVADAAKPLYASLDDMQKRVFVMLGREMMMAGHGPGMMGSGGPGMMGWGPWGSGTMGWGHHPGWGPPHRWGPDGWGPDEEE